jgi:hypothetical protein
MNTKSKAMLVLLASLVISSCRSGQTMLKPTSTLMPTPDDLSAKATALEQKPEPVVYYYFVTIDGRTPPPGSVVILANTIILAPARSEKAPSLEPAANIRSALDAMIHDGHNLWTSSDLEIAKSSFNQGHAEVALQGNIFGAGDIVLIAARMQILMTVFSNPSVESATVTLNGESIANLGISNDQEARAADYVYGRAEIEAFMRNNAYAKPG